MNDGGPAFPILPEAKIGETEGVRCYDLHIESGFSLRDYFAAKAMQGLMSKWYPEGGSIVPENFVNSVAKYSYEIADAMLKVREESK